jgi:GNAT superfamily N-acetyltransferase
MLDIDLERADHVMRLAFGTVRGLPDPSTAFGDREMVRTRFEAAPEWAWVAEVDGDVVGSVFAARWGSFGVFGPLTVHPALWDRGIGSRLLVPVLQAFERWDVRQAGLYTFAASPKHLGLYQKHGFQPRHLVVILATAVDPRMRAPYSVVSGDDRRALAEIRLLTDEVFTGLELGHEVVAANAQGIGETVLVRREGTLEGMAVCHYGAGSEGGSDTCYVKFAAALPGDGARDRFSRLLDACEAFAAENGLGRLEVGVDTGRLDAYGRLLDQGFRIEQIGVSMLLHPRQPYFDTPSHCVIADLR